MKTLPAVGTVASLRIGLFGDLGDTLNSSDTLNHLQGNSPDIVYNVGDLSYADKHYPAASPGADSGLTSGALQFHP